MPEPFFYSPRDRSALATHQLSYTGGDLDTGSDIHAFGGSNGRPTQVLAQLSLQRGRILPAG